MSYSKPKQISTGALELNNTLLKETLKDSDQQEANRQARNTQNISALVNTGLSLVTESIAPKADALSELNKDYQKQTQKLYNKVGSAAYDTGFEGTDKKADVFMNGLIDDYYRIKNSIKDMKDPSLGQQDLAMIENMVNQYGDGVTNMVAFNSQIEKATKADLNSGGKLSRTGAPAAQLQIIRKISGGGAEAEDIEFRREGGNIMLYDRTTKQTLNITEFNKAQQAGEQYLKFAIPTEETTSGFFKKVIEDKSEGGTFLEKFTTKNDKGGFKMTTEQQADYKDFVMGKEPGSDYSTGGMFEGLLAGDGNVAESIWEDQMFDAGIATGQWPTGEEDNTVYSGKTSDQIIEAAKRPNATEEEKELYKLFYKDFYEPALNFLAGQSLQGANELQITLDEEQEENTEGQKQEEEIVDNKPGAGDIEVNGNKADDTEVIEENTKIVYGAKGFNTEPTKEQAENLKKAAQEPKTEDGFIKANQIFEENAGRTDNGKLAATPQTEEDLKRYFYTEDKIPNTNYSDGNQKYGTKKLFPNGEPNTAAYDMAAMINMNSAWDPRIIAAIAGGEIKPDERGDYLFGRNDKELQKSIDLSNVDPQKMLNEMTDLYKNTYAKSENSSEMKKDKQLPEQYASYIERIKFIADRYGLELPKGYNEFGRPKEEEKEESKEVVLDTSLIEDDANDVFAEDTKESSDNNSNATK